VGLSRAVRQACALHKQRSIFESAGSYFCPLIALDNKGTGDGRTYPNLIS
jgi:hypothetical protein